MNEIGKLKLWKKVEEVIPDEIGKAMRRAVGKASGKITETFNRISGKNVETRLDEFMTVYGQLLANMDDNIDAISVTCIETQRQVQTISHLQEDLKLALTQLKRNSWKLTLSLSISGTSIVGLLALAVYVFGAFGR
jgi:hypothetical protein